MASSVNITRILKAVTEVRRRTEAAPRICVVGAADELRRVVEELSARAADERAGVSDVVDALTPADFPRDPRQLSRWRAVVVVARGTAAADARAVVDAARGAGTPVIGLLEETGPAAGAWARGAGLGEDELARGAGRGDAPPTVENRLVKALGDEAAALAARLPALRRAYADHVVLANATQNAAIGAVVIIPGADMPAMTINQVRMVLKIAAAYGEELGLDRALEILSVVGTGFVFRAIARQALDFVPGFGWALKGAVGFSGTVAIGQAAIAYFEAGAPLRTSRMQRINRQLERGLSRLPGPLARQLGRG